MKCVYAQATLYLGTVDSQGLSEGWFTHPIPSEGDERRAELKKRIAAWKLVHRGIDLESFGFWSKLASSRNEANEIQGRVEANFENVRRRRALFNCYHGGIVFREYLEIPGVFKENSEQLYKAIFPEGNGLDRLGFMCDVKFF